MPQLLKFFITHSWHDNDLAERLVNDLNEHGLDGFFDVYSVKPGNDIPSRINEGLEACDIYIPILSRESLKSKWCKHEIDAALILSKKPDRNGRPYIIPVLADDCSEELPPLLQPLLYVSFGGRYEAAFQELLNGISPHPLQRKRKRREPEAHEPAVTDKKEPENKALVQAKAAPLAQKQVEPGSGAPEKARTPAAPKTPQNSFPPFVILLVNIVVLLLLGYLLNTLFLPPCASFASMLGWAGLALSGLHVLWRYLRLAMLRQNEAGSDVELNLGLLKITNPIWAIDELHPWMLSLRWMWILALGLGLVAWTLGPSPFSPFREAGASLVIQNFLVRDLNGKENVLIPGDVLEIEPSSQVLVEARVLGQRDTLCTWFSIKGTTRTIAGCSTAYSLLFQEERDILTVAAQSACSPQQGYAGLHVKGSK